MKRLLIAAGLALAMSACTPVAGPPQLPSAPVALADRTAADEKALTAVELLYKASRRAIELGTDAGLIKGAAAAKAAELDRKAFAALTRAREAYRIANAGEWLSALNEALTLVNGLRLLSG